MPIKSDEGHRRSVRDKLQALLGFGLFAVFWNVFIWGALVLAATGSGGGSHRTTGLGTYSFLGWSDGYFFSIVMLTLPFVLIGIGLVWLVVHHALDVFFPPQGRRAHAPGGWKLSLLITSPVVIVACAAFVLATLQMYDDKVRQPDLWIQKVKEKNSQDQNRK